MIPGVAQHRRKKTLAWKLLILVRGIEDQIKLSLHLQNNCFVVADRSMRFCANRLGNNYSQNYNWLSFSTKFQKRPRCHVLFFLCATTFIFFHQNFFLSVLARVSNTLAPDDSSSDDKLVLVPHMQTFY